jgi:carbamoylphosphate synthase small subunit
VLCNLCQLLSLTFPMVGNYGVPDPSRMDEFGLPKGFESGKIHASALIVQDYSPHYSHWDAKMSLGDWLKQEVRASPALPRPIRKEHTLS